MKKIIYLLLLVFVGNTFLNAQLAGKKSKEPFKAIDGYTYKVGDVINIGFPTKGETYKTILYYKYESSLKTVSKFLDVVSGNDVEFSKIYYAPNEIKEFKGKIIYFKIYENVTYAISEYKSGYQIAIPLNLALPIREMISNNPQYKDELLSDTVADFRKDESKIKSFSPNFDVNLISAEGNIDQQTVTLTFMISHKLIHQEVCFNGDESSKLYDLEGNEYNGKEVGVGSSKRTGIFGNYSCNKIPTNVKVKAKVVFNKILPDKKSFSYGEIKVGYRAYDSSDSYSYGNLELNNIKVDWR